MKINILKKFGVGNNDIRVYESLLVLGRSKTGHIIKHSEIVSSQVYESLRRLITKGLVSYQVKNNIRYYQAELPDQLIQETKKYQEVLENLSHEIKKVSAQKTNRNEVNIYEGEYGLKKALTNHVEMLEAGEETSIVAFSPRIHKKRKAIPFFTKLDQDVIAKKAKSRMLLDKNFRSAEKSKTSSNFRIRYLPPGYFGFSALNISKREVLLFVWEDDPLVISIRNPKIIKGFQKNFDFLWGKAKS